MPIDNVITHVHFLDDWKLTMVAAARDTTDEQIIQIALDKIRRDPHIYSEDLTPANFRVIGDRQTHVPEHLRRVIIEYVPTR